MLDNLLSVNQLKGEKMKKILLTGLATLGLLTTSVSAYDLKVNMQLLGAEMAVLQNGFMYSDMQGVKAAVEKLSKHSEELLGNKEKFKEMLPKNKKHKAGEAVMSAQIIAHNVQIIQDAIENKLNKSGITRREESQRAFTYIEHACFRCHNIVRDVE